MSKNYSDTDALKIFSLGDSKSLENETVCSLPPFLKSIREQEKKFISERKSAFIQKIDESLFEMADRATSNEEKNGYLDSVREVRIWQHQLLRELHVDIDQAFNGLMKCEDETPRMQKAPGNTEKIQLSLVNNDELEEIIAIDVAVAKANQLFCSTVQSLSLCFDSLVPCKVNSKNNPVGPEVLSALFKNRAAALNIDIRSKIVMYKVFDKQVLSELGSLYKSIIRIMSDHDIALPTVNQPPKRNTEAYVGNKTNNIQSKTNEIDTKRPEANHANSESGSSYVTSASLYKKDVAENINVSRGVSDNYSVLDLPNSGGRSNNLVSLLSALQHQPQGLVKSEEKVHDLLYKLTSSGAAGGSLKINESENEVLTIFENIFTQALEDVSLPQKVKSSISQLQIPLTKVALLDSEFLSQSEHSARRLLNELMSSALHLQDNSVSSGGNPLARKINQIITYIVRNFDTNVKVFDESLVDFLEFKERYERRANLVEKRIVEAENGKATFEKTQSLVNAVLNTYFYGRKFPGFLQDLIGKGWKSYLTYTALKYGVRSHELSEGIKTLRNVLSSTRFPKTDIQRKRLLKASPVLVKRLRRGLKLISYDPTDIDQWLNHLEDLHLVLVKNDSVKHSQEFPVRLAEAFKNSSDVIDSEEEHRQFSSSTSNEEKNTAEGVHVSDSETSTHEVAESVTEPKSTISEIANPEIYKPEISKPEISKVELENSAKKQIVGEELQTLAADDPQVLQVESFVKGAWFEFELDDRTLRCRFAALIPPTGQYVFVNHSGMKVLQNTKIELAHLLKQKKLRPLDSCALFDRTLETIVAEFKKKKNMVS